MTPKQFKQIRASLDLTQTQLAVVMRTSRRTIARYEGGESKIDGPAEVLMELLAQPYQSSNVIVDSMMSVMSCKAGRD